MPKKGDIAQLEIVDLAFGGDGVAKMKTDEGELAVFVAGCVPGDKVEARLLKIKKQHVEARLEKILTPSKARITPRCKHFASAQREREDAASLGLVGPKRASPSLKNRCGGCSLQFLSYEDQLKWKQKMVNDSLERIGGFHGIRMEPILGCESPWFYRNKMEYSFGADAVLGLHPAKNYKEVFDLEECFLQSPRSVEIALAVEKWGQKNRLSGFDPRSGEGLLKNLVIREGKNTNEIMVNLVTAAEDFPPEKDFAEFLRKAFPDITSCYRTAVTVRRGFRTAVKEFLLFGKPALSETLTVQNITLKFEIYPQAFFQPNTKQAEILYGKIVEFAEPKAENSMFDLFCGTGTIGMFFAKLGCQVTGIELNKDAIENAHANARINGIENIEFLCGDINKEQPMAALFDKKRSHPLALITDPPRAGIAQKSLEKIIALKIPKWIYVSCNPTTLARDLKIICETGGYKIEKIQPVDMFPHTYHVETVVRLTK